MQLEGGRRLGHAESVIDCNLGSLSRATSIWGSFTRAHVIGEKLHGARIPSDSSRDLLVIEVAGLLQDAPAEGTQCCARDHRAAGSRTSIDRGHAQGTASHTECALLRRTGAACPASQTIFEARCADPVKSLRSVKVGLEVSGGDVNDDRVREIPGVTFEVARPTPKFKSLVAFKNSA